MRSSERQGALGVAIFSVLALSLLAPPPALADSHRGLELKRASVEQKVRSLIISFTTREQAPRLKTLRRFPSSIGAEERHLCAALNGRPAKRMLLCVGPPRKGGTASVGVSRYSPNRRRTRRLRTARARLLHWRQHRITVEVPLAEVGVGTGRLRWRALSGWRFGRCDEPGPDPGPEDGSEIEGPESAEGGAAATLPCADRWPRSGTRRARIKRTARVGCSRYGTRLYRRVPRAGKRVALTFDDGPSTYTGQIAEILERNDAHGTFFVVGSAVRGRERTLRQALAAGHELANHSWRHERFAGGGSMRATNRAIKRATGFVPCTYRPPYGLVNSGVVSAAWGLGMSTALWDIDTLDWQRPGSAAIARRALRAGRGSIVLMHDAGGNRSQTVAALPAIIRGLRSRGFELVTLTELLGEEFRWVEVG